MAKVICFDLEGPLSPQDNAYEVMGLVNDGHKVFEVLSKYDDILALEKRPGYEPGDTLSLILPFLVSHGITEEDIRTVSATAGIVSGVEYTIGRLKESGWDPYIISTSYEQHACSIAERIGVSPENVYCTRLPLDAFDGKSTEELSMVEDTERMILEELFPVVDDEGATGMIKERLDKFFWGFLPGTGLGKFMKGVKVVGGQRKVDSVYAVSKKTGVYIGDMIVVGDSITDYKMLGEVKSRGGVSVVFNGNEYSIPYANIGLASPDMRMILAITSLYASSGKKAVFDFVCEWEEKRDVYAAGAESIPDDMIPLDVKDYLVGKKGDRDFLFPCLHQLENIDESKQQEVLRLHKKARSLVRGACAKLG